MDGKIHFWKIKLWILQKVTTGLSANKTFVVPIFLIPILFPAFQSSFNTSLLEYLVISEGLGHFLFLSLTCVWLPVCTLNNLNSKTYQNHVGCRFLSVRLYISIFTDPPLLFVFWRNLFPLKLIYFVFLSSPTK